MFIPLGNTITGPIAIDSAGHLAVCEAVPLKPIQRVVLYSAPFSASSTPYATFVLPLPGCGAFAFDRHGNFYVTSDGTPARLWIYSAPLTSTSVPSKTITSGLTFPIGLAFDANGNLYVSDNGPPARILVYAPPYATVKFTITGGLTAAASLLSLAVDPSGNLYVTDGGSTAASLLHVYKAPLTASSTPAFTINLHLDLSALPSALSLDSRGALLTAGGLGGLGVVASYAPPFSATSVPNVLNGTRFCCFTGLAVGP